MNSALEKFYDSWSNKTAEQITYDVKTAEKKARRIIKGISSTVDFTGKTVLDFGCGYGKVLDIFAEYYALRSGYGFDFSENAIQFAKSNFTRRNLNFYQFHCLDNVKNLEQIRSVVSDQKVDAIILVDVLEHIPDCRTLIKLLAEIAKYFIIKLPLESSLLNNYILPKEYPSPIHSDGHLREFDVNDVRYFIRKLGLTPLSEKVYIDVEEAFPPPEHPTSVKSQMARLILKAFKEFNSHILPKKIFLKLMGGGGYFCIATFCSEHILNP